MLPRFYESPNVTFLRNKRVSLLRLLIRAGPLGQHVLHGVLTPGSRESSCSHGCGDLGPPFRSPSLIFFFPPALPPRPALQKYLNRVDASSETSKAHYDLNHGLIVADIIRIKDARIAFFCSPTSAIYLKAMTDELRPHQTSWAAPYGSRTLPPRPQRPMTPEQVVRELRRIRYARPPSIRAIARQHPRHRPRAGICHASVYATCARDPANPTSATPSNAPLSASAGMPRVRSLRRRGPRFGSRSYGKRPTAR